MAAYGDAKWWGDVDIALNSPVTEIATFPAKDPTVSPLAYRLVGSDGGVFNFGVDPLPVPFSAASHGSAKPTPDPVISITSTITGKGYWLMAQDGRMLDGGVIEFGDAPFLGHTLYR